MSRRFRSLLILVAVGIASTYKTYAQESSWTSVFDNYYVSCVETTPWGLLAGEFDPRVWLYPYNGIYISKDLGQTWKDLGLKDKGITDIKHQNDSIYATTYYHTETPAGLYKSNRTGTNWEHLGPEYSSSKVEVIENTIILGTFSHGIYISQDNGTTWEQKTPEVFIDTIEIDDGVILANSSNRTFKSIDMGNTWEEITYTKLEQTKEYKGNTYTTTQTDILENGTPTNLNRYSQDIDITYSNTPYIYASVNGYGIYRYEVPQLVQLRDPILSIPWEYTDENELIDRITAYFDHKYPLLGYPSGESSEDSSTTVNFFGIEEYPPLMYYSSHNGTDYSLPYGTPLYATAEGVAKYFWCNDCGNSIEIDHLNGYKTVYMHLQENLGISKDTSIEVTKGQYLGKVGMSGNTTGPHLHMTIKKDDVVIDPYGWNNSDYQDPWERYDNGAIQGATSIYLWDKELHSIDGIVSGEENNSIELDNKNISMENSPYPINYNIKISNYVPPKTPNKTLMYVPNTSVLIEAVDLLGNVITNLVTETKISFNLGAYSLTGNPYVYSFNSKNNAWEPLVTFFDEITNTVYAYTTHFSQFAVFEEGYYSEYGFRDKVQVKGSLLEVNY